LTRLGKFELHELIGQGSFGSVYSATDVSLKRPVAIKVLKPLLSGDPEFIHLFQREAEIAANVDHANIVPIYDLSDQDGQFFIVMKYMPAGSLADWLASSEPLPLDQSIAIFRQVCAAMGSAHAKGYIHRDLKPSNILFDADGSAMVGDFGLACAYTGSYISHISGGMAGTSAYRAPELWDGEPPASPATDVYSLGCILWELLSGKQAFTGATPGAIITRHLVHGPDWSTLPEGINPAVRVVLKQALARDPSERYQSASQLWTALEAAYKVRPAPEPVPTDPKHKPMQGDDTAKPEPAPPKEPRRPPKWLLPASLTAFGTALALLLVIGVIVPEVEKNTSKAAQITSNTQTAESSTYEANQSETSNAESTQKAIVQIQDMTATAENWTQTPTLTNTPSKTATRKPTSTLTPTQTVIPADKILYENDFESQSVVGWDNTSNTPFSFPTENGNQYLHFKATGFAYPGFYYLTNTNTWKNYAFESRIRTDYYLAVCFRAYGNNASFYNFHFTPAENWIGFADYDDSRGDDSYLSFWNSTSFIPDNQWITLRIEAKDDTLKAFINNRLVASESRSSLSYGGIGYNMGENSEIDVDDIRVWSLD